MSENKFEVRDGSFVSDRRLGCLKSQDERRFGFSIMGLVGDNRKL